MKKLQQSGDTIVEVLIAMAVVALVLSGAYNSARRSYIGSRQSQERNEATQVLVAQLEQLKGVSKDTGSGIFAGPALFCFNTGTQKQDFTLVSTLPDNPDDDNFANYPSACKYGYDSRYNVAIMRTNTNTFTASARWDDVSGAGKEQIKIVYRVYP